MTPSGGRLVAWLATLAVTWGACGGPGDLGAPPDGDDSSGDDASPEGNDAESLGVSAPGTALPGAAFSADVTMLNTGSTPWTRAGGYFLGSQDPMDNLTWGTNRGWMDEGAEVEPGGAYTFHLDLTAPSEPGAHSMTWQMLQDAVEWFGDPTSPSTVTVGGDGVAPWTTVTESELRAWRGSIATTLAPLPCGPRPGESTNIAFTAQYDSPCWTESDRALARDAHHTRGYTHWAMGPVVQAGYHGWYPDTDWRSDPDAFLDRVEELWWDGFIPALFQLPDTGLCADGTAIDTACVETELTPLYGSARFQELARIVVLAWEPNFSAADWQWGVQWMERTFPAALRYIHFTSGHGAPGLGSELEPEGPYENEAAMWNPVAPSIHGFLMQATWTFGGTTDKGRTPLEQFEYDLWDLVRRFQDGYAGWPTSGAGGAPIDTVAFEYASYYVASDDSLGPPDEVAATALEWGAAALGVEGVAGYGDGGP